MKTEASRHKILTFSFVVASFVVGLVVSVLLDTAIGSSGLIARYASGDLVRHGLPVFLGLTSFVVLQFNPKIRVWADESLIELSKVVWPSPRDTRNMTIVVCIMLIISSLILGLLDFVSTEAVQSLLLAR